jgi:putative transposase
MLECVSTPRYRKNAGSVFNLHYHFVWCPKYRKSVLVGPVEQALKQMLAEKAEALDVEIESMEVMPDHVHLLVSAPPTEAPQHLVNQFKGDTSRLLREQFKHLRTRLPSLWSRSYYVGSAGAVTEETVKRYIEQQKTRST